jgi:Domain of unknown function (DUF1824)
MTLLRLLFILSTNAILSSDAFSLAPQMNNYLTNKDQRYPNSILHLVSLDDIHDATECLSEWDKRMNLECVTTSITNDADCSSWREYQGRLQQAVLCLHEAAQSERDVDSAHGQTLLGICASSASEGINALKEWVTTLQLPRGLLHGMDQDGVPLTFDGGVYIKYNSGGVFTFADLRRSGRGLDALWKPGDAMLEEYDGVYRGVYFQVQLKDGEFRQFLLPLDLWRKNGRQINEETEVTEKETKFQSVDQ